MCYCLNSMDSESWKYQMFIKKVKPDEVTLGYNYREQDTENWPPNALFFFFFGGELQRVKMISGRGGGIDVAREG